GPRVGLADRLYDETEGLPFFLVEYLAALRGPWTMDHGPSIVHSPSSMVRMPGGVIDLLHSRLRVVDETGWQLLNTAAVIGRSFDFDTLREASGRSEEEA